MWGITAVTGLLRYPSAGQNNLTDTWPAGQSFRGFLHLHSVTKPNIECMHLVRHLAWSCDALFKFQATYSAIVITVTTIIIIP